MYLTAQHVRSREGDEEFHSFLHFHGLHRGPFDAPLSVPEKDPGKLEKASSPRRVRSGGNTVLSYLDIIAEDIVGRAVSLGSAPSAPPWWQAGLESLSRSMAHDPVPWVAEFDGVHVIFNATPPLALPQEYDRLVSSALDLWSLWRVESQGSDHSSRGP